MILAMGHYWSSFAEGGGFSASSSSSYTELWLGGEILARSVEPRRGLALALAVLGLMPSIQSIHPSGHEKNVLEWARPAHAKMILVLLVRLRNGDGTAFSCFGSLRGRAERCIFMWQTPHCLRLNKCRCGGGCDRSTVIFGSSRFQLPEKKIGWCL